MNRLPRFVRRILALSILAALLGTAWLAVGEPIRARHAAGARQMEDDLVRIGRYEQMIAERPMWEGQLEQLTTNSGAAAYLITADNPALAGAQLQNEVKRTAAVGRATVRSLQVLPAKDEGAFLQVGVRATMMVEMSGLTPILYQLEAAGRPFRITQLSIRGNDIPGRAGQAGLTGGVMMGRPLEVRFDLYALMRKPSGGGS